VPDNVIRDGRLVYPEGVGGDRLMFGNHVFIDHGNGELSQLAHLRAGSLRVRAGDTVRAGQPLGEIGFSGDTGFHVHLHHHVVTPVAGPMTGHRGVPLVFERFRVWRGGDRWQAVDRGAVETGEIVAPDR
jgi:murein DD-endopeptidase MepM/ murein hydrolase activator NlpD